MVTPGKRQAGAASSVHGVSGIHRFMITPPTKYQDVSPFAYFRDDSHGIGSWRVDSTKPNPLSTLAEKDHLSIRKISGVS
ncbi:MAG: hypothetical protein ABID54_13830 [Pseudomonadota bacterium]